ncbi:cation transporter-like permease [Clostridium punense]|uniref:Cation transporter-like permease n=1 Tax=Clostridium punense TaxID=1054297 RepID=A0ABS4K3D4_9CLOT|nr:MULTISPECIES: InlB B-repeat-containing protein [Clostridium]EQB87807.1 hypothetical protein M918_07110 [Clostridium sp. BL8]MBP2022303.1 cation transporter-like permease [Clostridium punense]
MKKFRKGIIPKILILTMLANVIFTAIAPSKTASAITPNTISFNSDPFGSNFQTQPYDVITADFGQITFKGTDDSLVKPFESLSWMAGQGMAYAGYYTGDSSWHGLMLSADSSSYKTGIWFVLGTKDRSKKFSFQSFNVGEYGNTADTMEVIGFRNGVQVASQIVTFEKYSLPTKTITMDSEFGYVDEIRMRQKTEGLYNGGYPGFEGIVVNDFVLDDPIIPKFEFNPTSYSIGEKGGSATLTVKRTGSSNGLATVDYATSDGTAVAGRDYTSVSGTLTFASGQTSKTISIPVKDNLTYDGDRFLNITLSNPSGDMVLGSQNVAILTIEDDEFMLNYAAGPNGTIIGNTSQTVTHSLSGTEVTAVPNPGYHFVSWSDGVTTPSRTDSNVVGDINVIANFAINEYTLKYTAGANGSITGAALQTVNHGGSGTEVKAVPNPGYHFIGWSDGITTPSRTDSNIMGDISITANFAINEYTLKYTAGANGSITGNTSQTVAHGASGTEVTAVPNTGYHFIGWSDGVTTASRVDSNVMGDISVTANFAINGHIVYTLNYAAGANGSITGIALQTVNHGENGTEVRAVPNPGYHFVSWSDGVTTPSRTDINVVGNISVTAQFDINGYTLKYTTGANGSIKGAALQTVNHGGSGTEVTAVPNPGYHFVGWSDGVRTASRTDSNVMGDISVTANFAINGHIVYTLNYTAGPNGSITGNTSQTVAHGASGTEVTAVSNPGYYFVSWSDGVTTPSRVDSNVMGDISVTAIFAVNEYTLKYSAGENGSITGTALQTVNHGGSGTEVRAVPNLGYHFIGWSDGATTASRTDINVVGNISVTANFAINEYMLNYTAGANGSITGNTSQTVAHGARGTQVTAVPNPGYHFVSWSDGVTTASRTDSNVAGNISVIANFEINSYIVTFKDYDGKIIGIPQVVNHGNKAVAPADPIRIGYVFKGWDKSFNHITESMAITAIYESGSTYTFPAAETSDNTWETQIPIEYFESRDNILVINNNIASLSIPASAIDLSGVSGKGYIKVTLKVITDEKDLMSLKDLPAGLRIVGNPINLTIQLFDKSGALVRDIHNFENNEKVKTTIKLTSKDIKNLDINTISIYTYNEVTEVWEELGGNFESTTQEFTFYTSHFSVFAVTEKTSKTDILPQAGSLFNFYAIVSLGFTITLLGIILITKKSRS